MPDWSTLVTVAVISVQLLGDALSSSGQLSVRPISAPDGTPLCAASSLTTLTITGSDVISLPDTVRCAFELTSRGWQTGFNYFSNVGGQCALFNATPHHCYYQLGCQYYEVGYRSDARFNVI